MAALWGFAEATLFFVIPDVFLSGVAVRDWRNADGLDEPARAVLAATDEMLETGRLSDEVWEKCHGMLGRDASIDLVASIGTWSLISLLARGLGVPLEEGVASWPPEGDPSPGETAGRIRSAQ